MFLSKITVHPHERVLAYRDGRLEGVLDPGRHRRRTRTELVRVDLRERIVTLAPQEVLTADGVTLRVTAALVWAVVDPVAFHERSASPDAVVYLAAQLGLREALSGLEVDGVLTSGRRAVADTVTATAAAAGESVGIAVREAVLKDVLGFPRSSAPRTPSFWLPLASAARRSSSPLEPRRPPCGRSRTAPSCSTSTRPWRSCGWCRPRRTARR